MIKPLPIRIAPKPLPRPLPKPVPKPLPVSTTSKPMTGKTTFKPAPFDGSSVWFSLSAQTATHEEFVQRMESLVRILRSKVCQPFNAEYVHSMLRIVTKGEQGKLEFSQVGTLRGVKQERRIAVPLP